MVSSLRLWSVIIGLVALVPVGIRVATWRDPKPEPVDPAMAGAGQTLFIHEWTPKDPLANGGDGLGPVFNARSCVACHNQPGPGGSGGLGHNVTTFVVKEKDGEPAREGVVHAFALNPKLQETLAQVDPRLPNDVRPSLSRVLPGSNHCLPFPQNVHLSQRNTPALYGANLIDAIPDRVIIANEKTQRMKHGLASPEQETMPVGRALRLPGGRVGKFGWKAQSPGLGEFVQAACANELGLGNPDHPQPRPLGQSDYADCGMDLSLEQCNQLTAFIAALPRPVERLPAESAARDQALAGKAVLNKIGCADCHTPHVGDVDGIYSDLLLHPMGEVLVGGGSYNEPPLNLPKFKPGEGPVASEWRTPPLWGVADSAPYMHDGRAPTLEEAIKFHGGQAAAAAGRFAKLSKPEQRQLLGFLETLRAPDVETVAHR